MRLVDTNVLLYAISTVPEEHRKADAARDVLASADLALSAQVLAELYAQATRPSRTDRHPHAVVVSFMAMLRRFPVLPITDELVVAAAEASQRFQLSYWDAAILEAARSLGCDVVLSEDLSDTQDYDGVRVVDPFADTG